MAGSLCANSGYWKVQVQGTRTLAHRIVWLLSHNRWPVDCIDHIDRNKANNRIENLREATIAENGQNRKLNANSTSGFKGVYWDARKRKWRGLIQLNKKKHALGYFDTPEEAHTAYAIAKAELHTFNPDV